jgi:hypothetical protein
VIECDRRGHSVWRAICDAAASFPFSRIVMLSRRQFATVCAAALACPSVLRGQNAGPQDLRVQALGLDQLHSIQVQRADQV